MVLSQNWCLCVVDYGGPFPCCSLNCGSGALSIATTGEAGPGVEQTVTLLSCLRLRERSLLLGSKAVVAVKQCCQLQGHNRPVCVSQQRCKTPLWLLTPPQSERAGELLPCSSWEPGWVAPPLWGAKHVAWQAACSTVSVKLLLEGNTESEGTKFPVFGAMNEQANGVGGIGTLVKCFHCCSRLDKELLSSDPISKFDNFFPAFRRTFLKSSLLLS